MIAKKVEKDSSDESTKIQNVSLDSIKKDKASVCGKKSLVKLIAEESSMTEKLSKEFLESFISVLEKELADGRTVQILGFGTFKVTHRNARTGMNPQTGMKIDLPAVRIVNFKCGTHLKQAANSRN